MEEFFFTVLFSILPTAAFMSGVLLVGLRVWGEKANYRALLIVVFPLIVLVNILSRIELRYLPNTKFDTTFIAYLSLASFLILPIIGLYVFMRMIKSPIPFYKIFVLYSIGMGIPILVMSVLGM